jgi:AhpD family alkylhydroperoxidase
LLRRQNKGKETTVKYLSPLRRSPSNPLVGQVYTQIKQDFGVIADPFRLHSPAPPLLAGIWSVMRETAIAQQVPWPIKEAVAASVSQSNECPYCVDIHAAVASQHANQALTDLMKQGRTAEIADPSLRAAVTWALATRAPGSAPLLAPPFSALEAPEMIGTAVAYHYINRMVQVFLPESLLPIFLRGGWIGKMVWRQVGQKLAHSRNQARPVGASLRFLPEADLPAEMSWAAASPSISRAFAGWSALVNQIGAEIVSPQVRQFVTDALQTWKGESLALGRTWVNQAVSGLAEADRATGSLALLTALAPYQIDEEIIRAYRVHHLADAHLVGVVAWASFEASRRIATFLQAPTESKAVSLT